ncbi:TIGR00730 family Rossman fold protein [Candidatus Saccharibacteria bacterium]|nr:TIGR00730 family Rossman fold protein [Candidatus Saccharibacteria bacterium]
MSNNNDWATEPENAKNSQEATKSSEEAASSHQDTSGERSEAPIRSHVSHFSSGLPPAMDFRTPPKKHITLSSDAIPEKPIEPSSEKNRTALQREVRELKKTLSDEDVARALAYEYDLDRGLNLLRTFSQGVTAFGSARVREGDKYYDKARELGGLLARNGHTVITGGGPGVMEALNRGAYEFGGRSVGLNITLEHEQFANQYLTDTMEFRYFFARKVMLSMASKVYVYFPGGFGTFDEFGEILCLMQENKMPRMPLFLFGKSFWKPIDKFFKTKLLSDGFINAPDLRIYTITDDLNDIVEAANKMGHPKIDENLYDHFVEREHSRNPME